MQILGIVLAICWLVVAGIMAWVGIDLSRIDEDHRKFTWTQQRVKIVLFSIVWPISIPVFVCNEYLRKI